MKIKLFALPMLVLAGLLAAGTAAALDPAEEERFDGYMQLPQTELARVAMHQLTSKYPDENWQQYDFPDYVFEDVVTEASYKIAVKEPGLLGVANVSATDVVIPCYCTCDKFGHANLLYCFYKNGDPNDEFDRHGSICSICMRQAFLAFLWSELGADHEKIMDGMEIQFAPVVEKYKQRNK